MFFINPVSYFVDFESSLYIVSAFVLYAVCSLVKGFVR